MIPNFLIIGAQKAGTTAMLNYLSLHPDVFIARDKEVSCFYEDKVYNKRFKKYSYEYYFSGWNGQKLMGNAPVNTMYFARESARNIKKLAPSIKLIAILRNPIDRAYSAYWYFTRYGLEKRSFEVALRDEDDIINQGTFFERCNFTYIDHGFYYYQLCHFLENFEREQILIILYDDFKVDELGVLKRVYKFLDLDEHFLQDFRTGKYNVASKARIKRINYLIYSDNILKKLYQKVVPSEVQMLFKQHLIKRILSFNLKKMNVPHMKESTREYLRKIYKEPNQKVGELMDRDLSYWV